MGPVFCFLALKIFFWSSLLGRLRSVWCRRAHRRKLKEAAGEEWRSEDEASGEDQMLVSSMELLGEPETVCAVCGDGEVEPKVNEILFCDACGVGVHQQCYGVAEVPEGDWHCAPCAAGEDEPVRCSVCLQTHGAMKPTSQPKRDTGWAHVICALHIPALYFQDTERMEPVAGIARIDKARFRLRCVVCKKKGGACTQCASGSCTVSWALGSFGLPVRRRTHATPFLMHVFVCV